MIVVDATVLVDFWLGEAGLRASAIALMEDDPDWISAGLWRYEFGNVVWKLVRAARFEASDMAAIWRGAAQCVGETENQVDFPQTYAIARQFDLSFYDASYVCLARSRGFELRTRDEKVLRKCPDVARAMPKI